MAEPINKLYLSGSAYLLQHKDNPVAWQTWGAAAFEEARRRNVPVLVSIGYSTCHWCHVMAHEVFENMEAADIMNKTMVCIKVDREENPEVDEVYMEACQVMNGSGGWPLNMFTDPDGKPFFAATYLPLGNWLSLIQQINEVWNNTPGNIGDFSKSLVISMQNRDFTEKPYDSIDLTGTLYTFLLGHYDKEHPDFSGKDHFPRFPMHSLYYFLLKQQKAPPNITEMLENALETIQDSGLHDRVGGGFHRYSTDREWHVPHFEKMLYDNAQLLMAYTMAAARFNRPDFFHTAENIADYLLRDMIVFNDKQFAGFASAEDADDPEGEGFFYGWTPKQLESILGKDEGKKLADDWNIRPDNSNHHGVFTYRIPHPRGSENFLKKSAYEKMQERSGWEVYRTILLRHRSKRPRPFRDTKILTDWNALALTGFAILYAHKPAPRFKQTIQNCANLLLSRISGDVIERLQGKTGHLTDYGHASLALFTAWEVMGEEQYLSASIKLVRSAFEKFTSTDGILYSCLADPAIFIRYEEKYDHAQPAGAHSLLLAWVRLRALGYLTELEPTVNRTMERRKLFASHAPVMAASFLSALEEYNNGPVTLSLPINFRDTCPELLKWIGTEVRLVPNESTQYFQFCEKNRCLLPMETPEELSKVLKYVW